MKAYINMVGTLQVLLSVYSRPGIAKVRIVPRNMPGNIDIDNTQIIFLLKQILKIVPRKPFPEMPGNIKINNPHFMKQIFF